MSYMGSIAVSNDGLANTTVGQWQRTVELGFIPPVSIDTDTLRLFFITPVSKGYGLGDGGFYFIRILDPQDVELGAGMINIAVTWPVIKLSNMIHLNAGVQYRIFITNDHPNVDQNYSSVNALWARGCKQLGWDGHYVAYIEPNGNRVVRDGYWPIFSLGDYSTAWMEVENALITRYAKEIVTPKYDILVKAVYVQTCGSKMGSQFMETGWSCYEYPQPLLCKAGVPVTFGPFDGYFRPLRKGTQQGFPDPFPEGYALYSNDGTNWAKASSYDTDISIRLELT